MIIIIIIIIIIKLTFLYPVVILHPFCLSNSPLLTQRSFSTPSDCQIHPSAPSCHLPPLLVVNLNHPPAIGVSRGEGYRGEGGDEEGRQETLEEM